MTVKELINKLKEMPQDVIVASYQHSDLDLCEITRVELTTNFLLISDPEPRPMVMFE